MKTIITLFALIATVQSIWPPAYKVDLSEHETFEISEELSSDDVDDIYDPDDEMIKEQDLIRYHLKKDNDKHFRIHQTAIRRNKKSNEDKRKEIALMYKVNETNFYDDLEPEPWIAGLVDKNGKYVKTKNGKVYYFNEMARQIIVNKEQQKREGSNDEEDYVDSNYDYGSFKAEYDMAVEKAERSKNTFNYTEVKEEESVQDAVQTIVKFGKAKNCTVEEMKGIGLKAAECFLEELKKKETPEQRSNLWRRIFKYFFLWLFLYIVVAIPCWCQNGWCCCCCCCRICYPRERIDAVKKFLQDNPVGVYHENRAKVLYKPTNYEKYVQKKLEKVILKL